MRTRLWLPLAAFVMLMLVAALGLIAPADRTVRSAMIGRPVPSTTLPPMIAGKPGIQAHAMANGRARLLNVFASWCVPCEAEAPQLMRLHAMGVPIDGIAVHDASAAVAGFLARNGDPYARIGDDGGSRYQLALGSSGVPETFVIDGDGVIRAQHIGAIRDEDVPALARAAGVVR